MDKVAELEATIAKMKIDAQDTQNTLDAAITELDYATRRATTLQRQNNELRNLIIEATKNGIDIPVEALAKL